MEAAIEKALKLGKIVLGWHGPNELEDELDAYVEHVPGELKPIVKVAVAKAVMDVLSDMAADHDRRRDHRERWWDYHYNLGSWLGEKAHDIRRWLERICEPEELEDPSLKAKPLHWSLKDKLVSVAHGVLLEANARAGISTCFSYFKGGEIIITLKDGCLPRKGETQYSLHRLPSNAAELARKYLDARLAGPKPNTAEMDERHADWKSREGIMKALMSAGILKVHGPEECKEILTNAVKRLSAPLEDDEPGDIVH